MDSTLNPPFCLLITLSLIYITKNYMASPIVEHHDEGVELSKNSMASLIAQHHDEGAQVEQELVESYAHSSRIEIPSHFILPKQQRPCIALNSRGDEIPIIDMAGLFDPTLRRDTMHDIHKACMEWGFFQAINHGVPHDVMNRMKECVEEFISLPISERAPHGIRKGAIRQGYISGFVIPNIGTTDWRDFFLLRTYPESERDHQIWPNNPTFREAINEYCKELKVLSTRVLTCLSENLGLPSPTSLEETFGEFYQHLIINHYPPCPQPDLTMGINKHTDLGVMTYLWQTEDIAGLQVLKDGEWVPVKPVPGAYLINVAYQVEIASNGIYKSVNHRATVNSTKRRISIACFHDVHHEAIVKPMPELITPNHPALYPPTRFVDHAKEFSIRMDKIGENQLDGK